MRYLFYQGHVLQSVWYRLLAKLLLNKQECTLILKSGRRVKDVQILTIKYAEVTPDRGVIGFTPDIREYIIEYINSTQTVVGCVALDQIAAVESPVKPASWKQKLTYAESVQRRLLRQQQRSRKRRSDDDPPFGRD